MVAMADALAREYKTLPTDLLGIELAPGTKILVNARILAYRNEQAKAMSQAESMAAPSPGGTKPTMGPAPGDRIRAKRMAMMSERNKSLRNYGYTNAV